MAELNLGKITGTQIFPATSAITTAPTGARISDLVLNGGASQLTIGGTTLAIGDCAPITTLSPLALGSVAGNIRGAQGAKGDTGSQGVKGDTGAQGPTGAKGDTGITGASINANGELILTTP